MLFPALFPHIQLLSYRCGCPNATVPDGRECPYEPTDRVEKPEDVCMNVRGLAIWASRLADRVFLNMRFSPDIGSMVAKVNMYCPIELVDLSFC